MLLLLLLVLLVLLVITFVQSIYKYTSKTNHDSRVHNVADILRLQFMVHMYYYYYYYCCCY